MTSTQAEAQDRIRAGFLEGEICRLEPDDEELVARQLDLLGREPDAATAVVKEARHFTKVETEEIPTTPQAVHDAWGPGQTVTGRFLADLVLGAAKDSRATRARLNLSGARIVGAFDLNGLTAEHEILFQNCWFDAVPDLGGSRLRFLGLYGCRLPGLYAWNMFVRNGVAIAGSVVTGSSDLSGAHIQGQLSIERSWLTRSPNSDYALLGEDLHVGRTLSLNATHISGAVSIERARVGGVLSLRAARLENRRAIALTMVNAHIGGGLFLARPGEDGSPEAGIGGTVVLSGAQIGGELEVNGLRSLGDLAIQADQVSIRGDIRIDGGTSIAGRVDLTSAKVGGHITMAETDVGDGLILSGAQVSGQVTIRDTTLRLAGPEPLPPTRPTATPTPAPEPAEPADGPTVPAQRQSIDADNTRRPPVDDAPAEEEPPPTTAPIPEFHALDAHRMTVSHNVALTRVDAQGGIALAGSTVEGSIWINDCPVSRDTGEPALLLDGVRTGNEVAIAGLLCSGPVHADDAKVGAGFSLEGNVTVASLQASSGSRVTEHNIRFVITPPVAVSAVAISVTTGLRMNVITNATVDLQRARVGEELRVVGAIGPVSGDPPSPAPDPDEPTAVSEIRAQEVVLRLSGAVVRDAVDLVGLWIARREADDPAKARSGTLDAARLQAGTLVLPSQVDVRVDLSDASVRTLNDQEFRWPATYHLTDLTYSNLARDGSRRRDLKARLRWLKGMAAYNAQPYRQLAAYYRETGRDAWARRVLRRSRRRRNQQAPVLLRPFGWLYDLFSGYGYSPGQAGIWFLAAVALGVAYAVTLPPEPIADWSSALAAGVDIVVPTSPFNAEASVKGDNAWSLLAWIVLQGLGWVLSLSIFPTLARGLSSDSGNRP